MTKEATQYVFDPTNIVDLKKTKKSKPFSQGKAVVRPMHPSSDYYGKLGCAVYYRFDHNTYGTETYERYTDEYGLHGKIKGMIQDYKFNLDTKKRALIKQLAEAKKDELPEYMIQEIERKLEKIKDNNIIAFKHEAYGYYKTEEDAMQDIRPFNIRDFVTIRTFPSVDKVKELNKKEVLQDTAHGPIYFKWIIVNG